MPRGSVLEVLDVWAGLKLLAASTRDAWVQGTYKVALARLFGRRWYVLLPAVLLGLKVLQFVLEQYWWHLDSQDLIAFTWKSPAFSAARLMLSTPLVFILLVAVQARRFLKSPFFQHEIAPTPLHHESARWLLSTFIILFTTLSLLDIFLNFLWNLSAFEGNWRHAFAALFPLFTPKSWIREELSLGVVAMLESCNALLMVLRIVGPALLFLPPAILARRGSVAVALLCLGYTALKAIYSLLYWPVGDLIQAMAGGGGLKSLVLSWLVFTIQPLLFWIVVSAVMANFWDHRWRRAAEAGKLPR